MKIAKATKSLTIVEVWLLLKLFENPDAKYSQKQLVKETCSEGLNDLKNRPIEKFIYNMMLDDLITHESSEPNKYSISQNGIIFVRQNLTEQVITCCNPEMHPGVIERQEDIRRFQSHIRQLKSLKEKITYIVDYFLDDKSFIELFFKAFKIAIKITDHGTLVD